MKKLSLYISPVLFLFLAWNSCQTAPQPDYPIQAVFFTDVRMEDDFWLPRLETHQRVTLPHVFKQIEDKGYIENFEQAAAVLTGGLEHGKFCTTLNFDDSDVYKIIEGASYSLQAFPDPELDEKLDVLIAKIAAAQEPDGYIHTIGTINPVESPAWHSDYRWADTNMSHELYNLGHMYEAAAAHFQATGKRTLFDVAVKNADLLLSVFGPGKNLGAPGHQEIEIGLVKLYRSTGKTAYLDLAIHFLDMRGRAEGRELLGEYAQDHKPVIDQTEAVGHAVRATYMYAGMADAVALTGHTGFKTALDSLWESIVTKKMYLTGGIGATGGSESFGADYELPNALAYSETCASIGQVLWNQRMFLLTGDSKYVDVLERVLYNGVLAGIGLSGDRFFYTNRLESRVREKRYSWFKCACCPSNISRFVPVIPGYIYAVKENSLYVNLFAESTAELELGKTTVGIKQRTDYPWEGRIEIELTPESAREFTVFIRIPGWARNHPVPGDLYTYLNNNTAGYSFAVNGQSVVQDLEKGYIPVRRHWQRGDVITLTLPMPVRRIVSHPGITENKGKIALERGPLVYCAEGIDNDGFISNLVLSDAAVLVPEHRSVLLSGLTVLTGQATALLTNEDGSSKRKADRAFTAIPYYAWAHRDSGEMAVWLPRTESAVRYLPPPTIATKSRFSASRDRTASALNDLWEPENSGDRSIPRLQWWPFKGTAEWARYDFEKSETVSEVEVYWADAAGLRVPKVWRILYRNEADQWVEVRNPSPYGVVKDMYNRVTFTPVRTTGLKLEIQLQEGFSGGILEWKVK